MKLDSQVVSLELSKQLKEAEYEQEGLWWWVSVRKGEPELIHEGQLGMLECNSPSGSSTLPFLAVSISELHRYWLDKRPVNACPANHSRNDMSLMFSPKAHHPPH